jgi:hypothetical protein
MPRFLCVVCRYSQPISAYVANVLTMYLHCMQGVPGAPYRTDCLAFVREPGADDVWPDVGLRGQMPTRYPIITAA